MGVRCAPIIGCLPCQDLPHPIVLIRTDAVDRNCIVRYTAPLWQPLVGMTVV